MLTGCLFLCRASEDFRPTRLQSWSLFPLNQAPSAIPNDSICLFEGAYDLGPESSDRALKPVHIFCLFHKSLQKQVYEQGIPGELAGNGLSSCSRVVGAEPVKSTREAHRVTPAPSQVVSTVLAETTDTPVLVHHYDASVTVDQDTARKDGRGQSLSPQDLARIGIKSCQFPVRCQ